MAVDATIAPSPDNSDEPASFLLVDDPKPRKGLARIIPDYVLSVQLLKLALPVVLGMVTQTAINILDTAMVGYLPKAEANPGQAAIGVALPFMWLIGGFLSAIWVGTQALTSRRAGEAKPLEAGKVLTNSALIALAGSIVFSVVAILGTPVVIETLYSDPVMTAYAVEYLQARYVGVLAMVGTFSFKSFFDGIGKTHVFMIAAVVMNLLNVLLNFMLIFGYEPMGVPRMGVTGAAWASVISAYVGLVILIVWTFSPTLQKRYHYYRISNLSRSLMTQLIRLSLPNGAATIVIMLGFSALYWVVGQVNAELAPPGNPFISTAHQDTVIAVMPSFMTSLAFGSATAAIVSQALGANRVYLAERYAWEAIKLWGWFMWLFGAVLFFGTDQVIGVFTQDPQVIEVARTPARMMAAIHGFVAMAVIFTQTLYGTGSAAFVMRVELVLHIFVMSPLAYFGGIALGWGLPGAWVGPVAYAMLLAAIMAMKFQRGDWKDVKL